MVTAVLITFKRQKNIAKIVDSLLTRPFIDEIMIWDNSKHENVINYGRYLMALKAKNDIIYTQDDDCLVGNVGELYNTFVDNPTRIVHGGTQGYLDLYNQENVFGDTSMALMGWGAFFNKNWINVLDRYTDKHGEDYCFYRETDRIFSILLNKKHLPIDGMIEHLEGYKDENALSSQHDHLRFKQLAIERCLKLL